MIDAVVGIDIGGTFTKYGLVDKKGQCLRVNLIKTDQFVDFDEFSEHLHKEIQGQCDSLSEEINIKGIGAGAPNGNYYRGTIEHAPNLKWKGIVPFVEKFKKYFPDLPVVLTNDANAAAIGEMVYGGAKNMKNFIVITLGTGLGSAFVVDGNLVYGQDGFAGELGHVNVEQNGRICGCGNKGCLEAYVSATGIKRTLFNILCTRSEKSDLRNVSFSELTSKMIYEAATKGDAIAREAFEITGEILGVKLSDVVAITNPEAIFILGGLAKAGELIFKPTQLSMEKNLFPVFRGTVKLLPSQLKGENAAVLGAGALAWKEWNIQSKRYAPGQTS
ncbi:MAG: ROK family protein [Smithellaceae bacterium]|nr:ROK family protein [Smithellaceae bacterium]